jgi:hypothetical protein
MTNGALSNDEQGLVVAGTGFQEMQLSVSRLAAPSFEIEKRYTLKEAHSADDLTLGLGGRFAIADESANQVFIYLNGRLEATLSQADLLTPPMGRVGPILSCVTFDPRGRLWVGTREGILRFDLKGH